MTQAQEAYDTCVWSADISGSILTLQQYQLSAKDRGAKGKKGKKKGKKGKKGGKKKVSSATDYKFSFQT